MAQRRRVNRVRHSLKRPFNTAPFGAIAAAVLCEDCAEGFLQRVVGIIHRDREA
jgi:hypothetical protein